MKDNRFIVGVMMQVFQALLITFIVLSFLDFTWFTKLVSLIKIEHIIILAGVFAFVVYNIGSWILILSKEDKRR